MDEWIYTDIYNMIMMLFIRDFSVFVEQKQAGKNTEITLKKRLQHLQVLLLRCKSTSGQVTSCCLLPALFPR